MTEHAAKDPLLEEGVQRGEGHGKGAEEDISQSEIRDEKVGHRLHRLVSSYDIADEDVSENSKDKDLGVNDVEEGLHTRMINYVQTPGIIRVHVGLIKVVAVRVNGGRQIFIPTIFVLHDDGVPVELM